eukprot:354060-Chlamydomonas_euryale.AAC.20
MCGRLGCVDARVSAPVWVWERPSVEFSMWTPGYVLLSMDVRVWTRASCHPRAALWARAERRCGQGQSGAV